MARDKDFVPLDNLPAGHRWYGSSRMMSLVGDMMSWEPANRPTARQLLHRQTGGPSALQHIADFSISAGYSVKTVSQSDELLIQKQDKLLTYKLQGNRWDRCDSPEIKLSDKNVVRVLKNSDAIIASEKHDTEKVVTRLYKSNSSESYEGNFGMFQDASSEVIIYTKNERGKCLVWIYDIKEHKFLKKLHPPCGTEWSEELCVSIASSGLLAVLDIDNRTITTFHQKLESGYTTCLQYKPHQYTSIVSNEIFLFVMESNLHLHLHLWSGVEVAELAILNVWPWDVSRSLWFNGRDTIHVFVSHSTGYQLKTYQFSYSKDDVASHPHEAVPDHASTLALPTTGMPPPSDHTLIQALSTIDMPPPSDQVRLVDEDIYANLEVLNEDATYVNYFSINGTTQSVQSQSSYKDMSVEDIKTSISVKNKDSSQKSFQTDHHECGNARNLESVPTSADENVYELIDEQIMECPHKESCGSRMTQKKTTHGVRPRIPQKPIRVQSNNKSTNGNGHIKSVPDSKGGDQPSPSDTPPGRVPPPTLPKPKRTASQ